jgi:hypothetical protein
MTSHLAIHNYHMKVIFKDGGALVVSLATSIIAGALWSKRRLEVTKLGQSAMLNP